MVGEIKEVEMTGLVWFDKRAIDNYIHSIRVETSSEPLNGVLRNSKALRDYTAFPVIN